jgi:hypothetical protein
MKGVVEFEAAEALWVEVWVHTHTAIHAHEPLGGACGLVCFELSVPKQLVQPLLAALESLSRLNSRCPCLSFFPCFPGDPQLGDPLAAALVESGLVEALAAAALAVHPAYAAPPHRQTVRRAAARSGSGSGSCSGSGSGRVSAPRAVHSCRGWPCEPISWPASQPAEAIARCAPAATVQAALGEGLEAGAVAGVAAAAAEATEAFLEVGFAL